MGKVYIVQEPMRKNEEGQWVSKGLNLAAATDFGDIEVIWPPAASILTRALVAVDADRVARDYDEENDYVMAVGSPSLIAMLAWHIGAEGKRLRMLEWDRQLKRYYVTMGG